MRIFVAAFALVTSCSRFGPVYPARPMPSMGSLVADPEPSRVVTHLAITSGALREALDEAAPRTGEGTFPMLGFERSYRWERGPLVVSFAQGRVVVTANVRATVALPLKSVEVPLDVRAEAEPIINNAYSVKLQAVDVRVTSTDTRLSIADKFGGIYEKIATPIAARLRDFGHDLRPLLAQAYARVSRPIDIPLGDANGCALLRVLEVEAGPTVLADGLERDVALVVAPSVMMPCPDVHDEKQTLPALSNVASITPGPFTVTIPIAARYEELTRAMSAAFTNGKLFFSAEYPRVYVEKPEIYEAGAQLVVKLHIAGPVRELGIDADLDGDLYLTGHPAVVDNELAIPDLEPTIESRSFLLSLKAMKDADSIRDQARKALRLDIGERLRGVRDKLGAELTFGDERGCFHGDVDRIEVTGVHAHAAYVRVYVAVTARARLTMPCASETAG